MGAAILSGIGIAAAGTTLDTVLLRNGRSIGYLIPDCTIEERHKDELEITQSPIEQGSPVADHAYLKPCELVMKVAWSESKSLASLVSSVISGSYVPQMRDVYDQLRSLQAEMQPFSVVTGKRSYSNMMLRSLQVITNKESEHALMVEALFQQVFIVSTSAVSASTVSGAPVVNTGVQQTLQANQTALSTIDSMQPLPSAPAY